MTIIVVPQLTQRVNICTLDRVFRFFDLVNILATFVTFVDVMNIFPFALSSVAGLGYFMVELRLIHRSCDWYSNLSSGFKCVRLTL